MKTLKKLFYTALVLAAGFVSCTKDGPTEKNSYGQGLYFSIDETQIYVSGRDQEYIEIPVYRTNSKGAYSTVLYASYGASNGDRSAFRIDNDVVYVDFMDGETETTTFVLIYNQAFVNYPDSAKTLTLQIADEENLSPYGLSVQSFTVVYAPWKPLEGDVQWRDETFAAIFGITVTPTVYVKADESEIRPGRYRLYNVYKQFAKSLFSGSGSYEDGDTFLYLNASDPDKVYIEKSPTGFQIDPLYGWMNVATLCPENNIGATLYGQLKNGVVTFPANSFGIELPGYNPGSYYTANPSGYLRIVLPGGVTTDPAVSVTYNGILTDEESVSYASFRVTMNGDAGAYRWSLAQGELSLEELDDLATRIQNGSADYELVRESGELLCEVDTPGTYTAVFVPVSEDGTIFGNASNYQFDYTAGGDVVTPRDFTAEVTFSDVTQTGFTFSIEPNSESLAYVFDVVTTDYLEEMVKEFGSIDAYERAYLEMVAQSNGMSFAEVIKAIRSRGAVEDQVLTHLEPETEYTLFLYCVNTNTGLARSEVKTYKQRTADIGELDPDYEGWLGTWEVTPAGAWELSGSTWGDAAPVPFQIEFQLSVSNQELYLYNWGMSGLSEDYPAVATWMRNTEDEPVLRIEEQFVSPALPTQYGDGYIALWDFITIDGVPNVWGGEGIVSGQLTGASTAELKGRSISYQNVTYGIEAMEYVVYIPKSNDILLYAPSIQRGPYTLKRVSTPSPASVKRPAKENRIRPLTAARLAPADLDARMARAMMKRCNCVELR